MGYFSLFHGTSFEGGKDIPIHGYHPNSTIWDCSDDGKMYFYFPLTILNREFDLDEDEAEEAEWENAQFKCMDLAKESGQIAEAFSENPHNYSCVIEFRFPDTDENMREVYDYIEEDYSCPNMELANTIEIGIINKAIKEKRCEIVVHYFPFYSKLSLFYLVPLFTNEQLQHSLEMLPNEEYDVLKLLSEANIPYSLYETIVLECEEDISQQMIYNFNSMEIMREKGEI